MSISKEPEVKQTVHSPSMESSEFMTSKADLKARDEALDFLEKYRDESSVALGFDKTYMSRLKRKIDWRFLPFGFVVITFNIIDKTLLNVGASDSWNYQLSSSADFWSVRKCHGSLARSSPQRQRFLQCFIGIFHCKLHLCSYQRSVSQIMC